MSTVVEKPGAPATAENAGLRVLHVDRPSIAERIGIGESDYLVALNNHPVTDVLDYWFHNASERVKIQWRSKSGELHSRTIRKAYHERLGIELEPFEIRRCANYCTFCFVHQLPTGMRRELYIKDEDYRLSFLYGNYITGTNLSPADKRRIIKMKLSPLYFSVHATDQDIREQLLAKKNIEPIIPLMKKLTSEGIFLHSQVVLCPVINDREILEKTVQDLSSLYPRVESIAVVPLGLTAHRGRLPQMQSVTPEYAKKFIRECSRLQRRMQKAIGYPFVFPSDEFYLIAGLEPPSYSSYPEIPQLANGVGMYYRFYEHIHDLTERLPAKLPNHRRVAAITTHMAARVLQPLVNILNDRVQNLELCLLPTTNSLFGEGITVSGLLPGADFKRQITDHPGFDSYLIPENALRPWDRRFLDDMLFEDLKSCTSAEVTAGSDTAESFVHAALQSAA
jgi:putative radical SAM enzyme (TIGR03279 family)